VHARVVAQRRTGGAAELQVVRDDRDALRAQILREDAPDLAVADEADLPEPGVARRGAQSM
jgi:hypothetical protein